MSASDSVPGRFGPYGGRYVPETLVPALDELEATFRTCWADNTFQNEFRTVLADYVGRPTPLDRKSVV